MEATYYTYFLYILIAMFISIAIILSAKNDKLINKLRISNKNNDDQKTIIGSQFAEIARINARLNLQSEDVRKTTKEMLEKTKELCEARKKTLEYLHETREENIAILSSPFPEKGRNETDAHYHRRCRQSVANKAAKYVKIADQITLRVIK